MASIISFLFLGHNSNILDQFVHNIIQISINTANNKSMYNSSSCGLRFCISVRIFSSTSSYQIVSAGFWKCLSKVDYSMMSQIIFFSFLWNDLQIQIYHLGDLMTERWWDVQDEEGVWRVGQCFFEDKVGTRTIGFDGFHPNYTTTFCKHSNRVLPIRTKTHGLTTPEDEKPLREVLTQLEIQNISGRLNLYLMKPNYLQFQPKLIKTSIRTQFLILVDKIMATPFQIIRQIKMMDLEISKFFINVLALYSRVIQFSKTFMTMLESNQTAQQLYKSIFQLTHMANLIFGIHPHSAKLYDHKLNINLKSMGFIDFFVMSETGLLPFRNFFKGASSIKKPNQFDLDLAQTVANLVLDLCEKAKAYLVDGPNHSRTILVLDEIINNFKHITQQNETLRLKFNNNLALITKIEALYLKFRPNKTCPLRKYITKEEPKEEKPIQPVKLVQSAVQKPIDDKQMQKLEERIKKLELLITNQQKSPTISSNQEFQDHFKFERPSLPIQNLGQQMFLGSLQWALENGDIQTAKKLTKWRKSLLQVGRITGWEVALAIGARTYKKQQITASDIIQANYQYLTKAKKS